jgi:hypothetical protein
LVLAAWFGPPALDTGVQWLLTTIAIGGLAAGAAAAALSLFAYRQEGHVEQARLSRPQGDDNRRVSWFSMKWNFRFVSKPPVIIIVAETLDALGVPRAEPTARQPHHLCLDKGYVGEAVESEVTSRGDTPLLQVGRFEDGGGERGHEPRLHALRAPQSEPSAQARPSSGQAAPLEGRTHSWSNRARRMLIRWEKKVANYLAFLHLQFAIVALRTAGVRG